MPQDSYFYFLKPPGYPATEKYSFLGRIVKNYASPAADYTPNEEPQQLVKFPAPPLVSRIKDVRTIVKASSESSSAAFIESMTSFSKTESHSDSLDFSASSIEVLRLQQHGDTFEALKRHPEVRTKLQKMLRVGGKVYMVVGVMVLRDGHLSVGSEGRSGATASASQEETRTHIGTSSGFETSLIGNVVEEQLVALEYRLIKRNLFGVGSDPVLRHEEVRYSGGRFYHGGDDEEDDEEDSSSEEDDFLSNLTLEDDSVEGAVHLTLESD